MTALAQGAAGLVLALSLALLFARRPGAAIPLLAAQTLLVAVAAVAQRHPAVAPIPLAEAAVLFWLPLRGMPIWPAASRLRLTVAAALAVLAVVLPGAGPPLATMLVGMVLLAGIDPPARQVLGAAVLQNGIALAAVTMSRSAGILWIAVLPWMATLTMAGLWLGGRRALLASLHGPVWASRAAAFASAGFLLLACLLPWHLGAGGSLWRLDTFAVHVTLLLAAVSTAASWHAIDTPQVWGGRLPVLGGTVLAVLATAPNVSWLGMAVAAIGAIGTTVQRYSETWRQTLLACVSLGLALFGSIATPGLPAAIGCLLIGYGTLAVLAPELTIAAVALMVRHRTAIPTELLLAFGIIATLAVAALLATNRRPRRSMTLIALGQGGLVVFAFGLGSSAGDIAGLLQLTLLALTLSAVLLSHVDGLDRLLALIGLAGVSPVGLFPGLALMLGATAARSPWLLLPVAAAIAVMAWPILLQLSRPVQPGWSLAWVPLALLAIVGLGMPDQMLSWLRLAVAAP